MKHLLVAVAAFVFVATAAEQEWPGREQTPVGRKTQDQRGPAEFTFVRTIYNSPLTGRRWRGWGSWRTDFPEADYHFIAGIRFWAGTNLHIDEKPVQLEILDDRLFDYPLIYFVEPGFMDLSQEEADRLREYVSRGGFLFLDDFWGEYEWDNVLEQMRRVFPDRRIDDLPLTHAVFHSYFDIDEVVQVPGIGAWLGRGVTYEKGGIVPHYMGIHDDKGRLVTFIARNCDLGDAWEWIDDARYPMKYGSAAYRVGLNVVMYAMTH
jgi:hypothetical protein